MGFELLGVLLEGGCCLLEILAVSADLGAMVAGAKTRKTFTKRRAAIARGEAMTGVPPSFWVFLILVALGAFLTVWVLVKWFGS